MEIRSNITEMTKKADNYGRFKKRVQSIREDLVDIMTDVDDYWSGRSGDSFKYICWYLKILSDSGYKGLDNLGNEISIAKEAISHNDINLSNQIQSKEHVKV